MYRSHQSLERDYEVTCRELNLMVDLARDVDGVHGARMTGGGFGGCTINLVESRAVPEFCQCIARKYEKATHISPQIFVTHAAGGASGA
jgi:galactokinase